MMLIHDGKNGWIKEYRLEKEPYGHGPHLYLMKILSQILHNLHIFNS